MLDLDRLESLLLRAARDGHALTYAQILGFFERRVGPIMVQALCRDLGHVCRRLEPRGLGDIACLVVRKSDGLPGDGYFQSLRAEEGYGGPSTGPVAEAEIRRRQDRIFALAKDLEMVRCET